MFSNYTGKKCKYHFFGTACNIKPSVRSAGIISLFEQKEKGKKSLVLPTYVIFFTEYRNSVFCLNDSRGMDFNCHSIPGSFLLFGFKKCVHLDMF